jgi:hypothetical protein
LVEGPGSSRLKVTLPMEKLDKLSSEPESPRVGRRIRMSGGSGVRWNSLLPEPSDETRGEHHLPLMVMQMYLC